MFAKIIVRLYSKKMEPGSDKFSKDPKHQQRVSKLAEIARTVVSDGVDTQSRFKNGRTVSLLLFQLWPKAPLKT